jgi:hypothetical protein
MANSFKTRRDRDYRGPSTTSAPIPPARCPGLSGSRHKPGIKRVAGGTIAVQPVAPRAESFRPFWSRFRLIANPTALNALSIVSATASACCWDK